MKIRFSTLVAATGLILSTCSKQDTGKNDAVRDPTAGRLRHTVFFSSNLWGDLLECG